MESFTEHIWEQREQSLITKRSVSAAMLISLLHLSDILVHMIYFTPTYLHSRWKAIRWKFTEGIIVLCSADDGALSYDEWEKVKKLSGKVVRAAK